MSKQFSTIAKNGMVASSQPLATLAGVEILMKGGNAIDAAIATAAVLGVVEPSSIGIGGDAFCLFYSAKDRAMKALDASGRSPYAASLDFCRSSGFKEMPQRGIHSVTIPGAVHGWATLLQSHGTKKLSDVLRAAIRHAEEGFPVAELTAEQWKESEARLKADEGAAVNYLIDGRTPKAGEIFKNPRMAATLKRIASRRRRLFLSRRDRPKDRALLGKARRTFHAQRFCRSSLGLGRADHRELSRLRYLRDAADDPRFRRAGDAQDSRRLRSQERWTAQRGRAASDDRGEEARVCSIAISISPIATS